MSAETAEMSIGSVAVESVGSATAEAVGESTGSFSPSAEISGTYSPSSLPSPEVPNASIEEISRPESLIDADFLPEPITSDFNIHEIVHDSFVEPQDPESIASTTQLDPSASVVNPTIIEEIRADIDPDTIPGIQAVQASAEVPEIETFIDLPGITTLGIPEPATLTEPVDESVPVDQEVGSLTSELLTLGSVQTNAQPQTFIETPVETPLLEEMEAQANQQTLQKALTYLETVDLPDTQVWQEKLEKAAAATQTKELAAIQTQIGIEAEAQTETETAAQTQTELALNQIDPPEDRKNLYNWYTIDEIKQRAKEVDEKRLELAGSIASLALISDDDPRMAAERRVAELDIDRTEEIVPIAIGKLKKDRVVPKIYNALSLVRSDPDQVANTIIETVKNTPSTEKVEYIKDVRTVEIDELPEEPKALIADGEKHLIWENKNKKVKGSALWKGVPKLPFKNYWEIEEAA